MITNKFIEKVGCKSLYQQSTIDWPICASGEAMRRHMHFNPAFINPTKQYGTSPCKLMSVIDFKIDEWAVNTDFAVVLLTSFPEQYRSTQLTKAIDFQSLVGNIGGYVGLFLGKNASSISIHSCTEYYP